MQLQLLLLAGVLWSMASGESRMAQHSAGSGYASRDGFAPRDVPGPAYGIGYTREVQPPGRVVVVHYNHRRN